MIFGGAAFGTVPFASRRTAPGLGYDPLSRRPIVTQHNGRDVRGHVEMDSWQKTDTLGQPVSASVVLKNIEFEPVPGDEIIMRYFHSVEFAGTIERVRKTTQGLQVTLYECQLVDWSGILMRRLAERNFEHHTVQSIVENVLGFELAGEGLDIGVIDTIVTIPMVDASSGARVFELFRELAIATGQTFRVEFNKVLNFTSLTVVPAPLILNQDNVLIEATEVQVDKDSYRNHQTVFVTGTPADDDDPEQTVRVIKTNPEQIAARQAIEGGTGIVESLEKITHPTSNQLDDMLLLANGYADLLLATAGTPRTTVRLQARGYGFRAGQIAEIDLPVFGLVGQFIVQRVSMREKAGQFLFHDLELTQSSSQRRAYESWIAVLGKGKIAVQIFGVVAHDSVEFETPGSHLWTVPAGVVRVKFSHKGPGGGGSGGVDWFPFQSSTGGHGGHGGLSIVSLDVTPGEEIGIFIGSAGAGGTGSHRNVTPGPPTAGTAGTDTYTERNGVEIGRAKGGGGGQPPNGILGAPQGATGTMGGGLGPIVTVGGGRQGGPGGVRSANGSAGQNGYVKIEW